MNHKTLLILCLCLLVGKGASASVQIGVFYYNLNGSEAEVTSNPSKYTGRLVIPESVTYEGKQYRVTKIGDNAFLACHNLSSIVIPESVTSIGNDAFNNCYGVTSFTIPESVTSIGSSAFRYCKMTSIVIPENVTSIGSSAFDQCSALITVTIRGRLTSIEPNTFSNCSSLVSVNIPEGVTRIGDSAFLNCRSLSSITIPDGVTSIGRVAFDRTAWYDSLPDGVVYAGKVLYKYKGEMPEGTEIVVEEGTVGIADYAFSYCTSLASITLPEGLTTIGSYAFDHCSGTASMIVPSTVTSVGKDAFKYSDWLSNQPNGVVYAGKVVYMYKGNMPAGTEITIKEGTVCIAETAFRNYGGLVAITFPESVTSICREAFNNCSGLTSLVLPSGLTSIDYGAFGGCSGLTSVAIPGSVTQIGWSAFYQCRNLTSITIPEGVESIDKTAFGRCDALTSIRVASGNPTFDSRSDCNAIIETATNELVVGCGNSVIPHGVTGIKDYAFYECISLKSIFIPNTVTYIGSGAFYRCSGLTSVTISNGVTKIGVNAFDCCSGLTSITLPESVANIGLGAIHSCSGLTSVKVKRATPPVLSMSNFPNASNLTLYVPLGSKDAYAAANYWKLFKEIIEFVPVKVDGLYYDFDEARKVAEVVPSPYGDKYSGTITIPSTVTYNGETYMVESIGEKAFQSCTGLSSVTVPDGLMQIGIDAFAGCYARLNANKGTDGLLALWNYGKDPYAVGMYNMLSRPTVSVNSKTQTTITYSVGNGASYTELEFDGDGEPLGNNQYLISGLRPDYNKTIFLAARSANNSYIASTTATTSAISIALKGNVTASSITVRGSYTEGDANVVSQALKVNGVDVVGDESTLCGLDPNTAYPCTQKVIVEYGHSGARYTYEESKDIVTAELTLATQQPRVISAGNVVVAAESNLDDGETNVGFEWRRTDWTDDFNSNTGVAYLFEGTMEGYIRNLYTEKLWKYRPYYEANSGNRYYGDWVGIDPTNTSYFEPTVHTYAQNKVTGNKAEVKGYAMRGTDRVTSQGFIYWKNTSSYSLRKKAASIPSDAVTVEASGNVMTATLEDLEYEMTYCYVAFVKTEENETFFGEVQTFGTDVDPDGIKEIKNEQLKMNNDSSWYDLSGRKLAKPQKGINIIRYSDGTTRKVMIK